MTVRVATPTRRGIAVLALAGIVSTAVCEPASAADPNSTILLSRPTGLGALPVPGENSGAVGRTGMSGNGRFVVFTSGADDLGVRDTLIHAWVRDTLSGTTTLVDRVPDGGAPGDRSAFSAAISRDGSTVCFLSSATNLVAGVTRIHVFVVTLATGAIVVADRTDGAGGAVGNGTPFRCALDAMGLRMAFDSTADNLVPLDTNGVADVFVRHLAVSATERVSVDSAEAQAGEHAALPAINADGTRIVFATAAALDGADTNGTSDVYVRDLQAGTTVRASVGTGGVQGLDSVGNFATSSDPAIDDAGTHVAFTSNAMNFDLGVDDNGVVDVFWRDLGSDTTILVSRAAGGAGDLGDGASGAPAISGDGLGVAFESVAANLGADTPPPPSGWVYLRRLGANETTLLSRASGAAGAPADASAISVSLGAEPTVASWGSRASNLDPDASGEFFQVFKRDLSTTTLVSRPSGTGPRSAAVNASTPAGPRAISADGRFVVFTSEADGLDPAAAGTIRHVFVRDALTNTTTLVSRGPGPAGVPANGNSEGSAIAAGGTHVAFISRATNLLDGVTGAQVYVRDLTTGALEVASRADGPSGALALDVDTETIPDVSADGRRVVFVTLDPLVPADTNSDRDVYVRDLVAGTTTLVSVSAGGGAGDRDSESPSVSDDGMRVAFSSAATNLLDGAPISGQHVYVRDLLAGTTVLADRDAQDGGPGTGRASLPEMSGVGNRVAFFADQALTPDVIPVTGAIYVRDLATGTTLLASRADGPGGAAQTALLGSESVPSLSHDGTRVAWTGSGAGSNGTGTVQVHLRDLAANTTRLVSAVDGTTATPGNRQAFAPALSAGGGCAAFGSIADDLSVPAYPTQDFSQVYLRAVEGECPLPAGVTTTTTLPPGSGTPISAKTVVVRPGQLVKLVAKGLPAASVAAADPTGAGGNLQVIGMTGGASYALPASGWRPVGRKRPKGFKFKGEGCRAALVRRRLSATCRGDTGQISLPEPGPLEVVLVVGSEAYCAECGGRAAGKPARVFKRKACPAPATCP